MGINIFQSINSTDKFSRLTKFFSSGLIVLKTFPDSQSIFQWINSTENFSRLTQLIAMFISVWLAAAGIGEKEPVSTLVLSSYHPVTVGK